MYTVARNSKELKLTKMLFTISEFPCILLLLFLCYCRNSIEMQVSKWNMDALCNSLFVSVLAFIVK